MFSVIICSVSQPKAEQVRKNVDATIGCRHETIVFDNSVKSLPLSQVYNICARKAVWPLLMFIHEDVEFCTNDWGVTLSSKLMEPDCGVVGFAGCRAMAATCSGWSQGDRWDVWHYRDHSRPVRLNDGADFTPVIAVDGFAFCVRRELALDFPFDETCLTGFHCYDVDFCLGLPRTCINYVCSCIDIAHFSSGSYNRQWYETTVTLYRCKWHRILPLAAGVALPSEADTELVANRFLYRTLRISDLPADVMRRHYSHFITEFRPSATHIRHCIQHGLKLLRNIIGSNKTR